MDGTGVTLPTSKEGLLGLMEYVDNQARADLARKVLTVIDGERLHENLDNEGDKGYAQALNDVTERLRELFQKEGINVPDEA